VRGPQRFRIASVPIGPAVLTGAWAGFVPGLFIGAILGFGVFIWLVASRAWNLWDAWNCAYLRGSDEESIKN